MEKVHQISMYGVELAIPINKSHKIGEGVILGHRM